MKKNVKASPVAAILFGFAGSLCIAFSVAEFLDTRVTSAATIALYTLVLGAGVYTILKYFAQSKIEFDEVSFTVGGKTYGFDEITKVTVNNEQVLRSTSTLRIKLYIDEEEICSFTKDDSGGKEFIAAMKNHGVSVSIDI